ncbi:MAG: ABC transporter ATP-binding protein [Chloroherpetonaceae bacterium]|nr:ABC transporter ATP-binding protein [Chthonomonadaceae bacterium]MDW8208766.1 ABC transporter ATP-binding protein [Chloroherpetonaceae bacterium]
MTTRLLEVKHVTKRFGGLAAVSSINMAIDRGELVGLIGPNGAGKTTVFNLLTGVYVPTEGTIHFDGRLMNRCKPYQIVRAGMARTFQNIRLFRQLTARDNVKVAAQLRCRCGLISSLCRTPRSLANDRQVNQIADELLDVMNLQDVADARAGDLAYGLQRRLEIARALATRPRLLLLDEPAAGMNPQEKVDLMALIQKIRRDFDLTVLLIEHDMKLVMGICERIYVLDYGQIIAEGAPSRIRRDPRVIKAYLGEEYGDVESDTGTGFSVRTEV